MTKPAKEDEVVAVATLRVAVVEEGEATLGVETRLQIPRKRIKRRTTRANPYQTPKYPTKPSPIYVNALNREKSNSNFVLSNRSN